GGGGGEGGPPRAGRRIALMPQVGARIHEIGRTHAGSRASGTRKPPISQTGYSKRLPSTQAARKRTNETANSRPSPANESTVATTASANRNGCSMVRSIPNAKRPQSSVATRL